MANKKSASKAGSKAKSAARTKAAAKAGKASANTEVNPPIEKQYPKGFKGFVLKNIYIILAFAVPFILMVTAFGLMNVSPFGTADKQILVTDLWHQYFPFLADFQDKLKNGESLFWTLAEVQITLR